MLSMLLLDSKKVSPLSLDAKPFEGRRKQFRIAEWTKKESLSVTGVILVKSTT